MKKVLLMSFLSLITTTVYAVCPVCTVAVAGGLGLFEWIGIDTSIGAVWIGGLTVSLIIWTKSWLVKHGITSLLSKILNIVIYYALTFSVYLMPSFNYGYDTLFGIDKLLLGIILGSAGICTGNMWYQYIKENNGGHAMFPYQKVVMPIGFLIIISLLLAVIIYF